MNAGQTLTTAANNLTAVRGQDSVQVLYQESIATNFAANNPANPSPTNQPVSASVTLFDPTVDKQASLTQIPTANHLPVERGEQLLSGPDIFSQSAAQSGQSFLV